MTDDERERSPQLVLVGTPIGNLGDLSPRAIEALASADVIACEDTRRTRRLLTHAGIVSPPLLVANEHTEMARRGEILQRLDRGEQVALVSDAGMPTLSDPGRLLVAAVVEAGHHVAVVPGPVAVATALALSGFDGSRFVFEGFLPRKGADRARQLDAIGTETRTIVLYEGPHRVKRTLVDLIRVCGPERPAVAARELTKLHEEAVRGSLAELVEHFEQTDPRGEFAIVISGATQRREAAADDQLIAELEQCLADGLTKRDAVDQVTASTGEPRRRVYALSTSLTPRP